MGALAHPERMHSANYLRVAPFGDPPVEKRDPLVWPRITRISGHRLGGEAVSNLVAPLLHIFVFRQVEGLNHASPLIGRE